MSKRGVKGEDGRACGRIGRGGRYLDESIRLYLSFPKRYLENSKSPRSLDFSPGSELRKANVQGIAEKAGVHGRFLGTFGSEYTFFRFLVVLEIPEGCRYSRIGMDDLQHGWKISSELRRRLVVMD